MLSICDIDFFNFHDRQVQKFKSSKFQNCLSETKILQSYFKIVNIESKSQQSTSQMNEREQR
jgi:hypothetical protein